MILILPNSDNNLSVVSRFFSRSLFSIPNLLNKSSAITKVTNDEREEIIEDERDI